MDKDKKRWSNGFFYFKNRNLLVDLLSAIYGLGSWIAMTGLWVELPLLVQRLPEAWTLPSRLTLVLQFANIGPIIYGVLNKRYPRMVNERSGTHIQLAIGTVSTLLLIFFWSSTVNISGSFHSIPLYILSFGLSIVDCTSSVVFLPYMAFFRSVYLIPYLVGEGFSGFLPSLLAMGQGIDNEKCLNESYVEWDSNHLINITKYRMVSEVGAPNFEPEWFFVFLLFMVLQSWVAFLLLDKLKLCKHEMVAQPKTNPSNNTVEILEMNIKESKKSAGEEEKFFSKNNDNSQLQVDFRMSKTTSKKLFFSRKSYFYFLFIQCWASIATFGVFPAIQSYSCLPYGNEPFHYAVTLCGLAYPIACLSAMIYEARSITSINILTIIGTTISVFIMYTAVMSPTPPLVGTSLGSYVIVICWVLFIFILSYVKTIVTVLLGDCWGQRGLFWCGAVTQAGAAIGALLMFLLINVFELFHDDGMCV